ncbi:MAG: DUF418 domain-containing protein [Burkholderiaceae bacterium]
MRSDERLPALDILRGVALLGIFIMNMPSFSASLFAEHATDAVTMLRDIVIAGKFNAMFAFLFGIGFALQLARLQAARPGRGARIYLRRLLVLMLLGLAHGAVFWAGDVLFVYSILGLMLLLLRRVPDRMLLGLVVGGVLFPALAVYLRAGLLSLDTEGRAMFEYQALEASNNLAYGSGAFAETARENSRMLAWAYSRPLGLWSIAMFYVQMGTPLALGYVVGRRGWVERLGELVPQMRLARALAGSVGAAATLIYVGIGIDSQEPTLQSALLNLLQTVGRLGLMLFYALTIAIVVQSVHWRERLAPLAAAGRMPLTNYLLQTAMATTLFYGWGFGWWGRADTAAQIGIALALFCAVQIPLSIFWLSRFERGPFEQLWRITTYGRGALQPARESPPHHPR